MNWKRWLSSQVYHCLLAVLCFALVASVIVGLLLAVVSYLALSPLIVAIHLYLKFSKRNKANGSEETKD